MCIQYIAIILLSLADNYALVTYKCHLITSLLLIVTVKLDRIKTSGSESQGQKEAACTCVFRPMQTLFTQMAGLNILNAVAQPLLHLLLSLLQT